MHPGSLRIGIYGDGLSETNHRVVAGVLRYHDEVGGFTVRDFRITTPECDLADEAQHWKGKVDGVIVAMGRGKASSSKEVADWVLAGETPAVSPTSDWFDPRIPAFVVDRPSLGKLAAAHLIECQCASFLHFGYAQSAGSKPRAEAFQRALAAWGRTATEVETNHRYTGGFENLSAARAEAGLLKALRSMPKPIGVWAVSDLFARGILLACEQAGLTVPGDVRLLGVDDLSIARTLQPQLSSIRTPSEEVGYQAMRALHGLIRGREPDRAVTEVPATEVVARASTVGAAHAEGSMQDVREYIARHACTGVTVDQLADVVGVSRRAFEVRFRDEVGHSPGQEIQRVRLDRAKHLLRTTDLSMSRVSSMVGYASTPAFTRFFRGLTGRSPTEYRAAERAAAGVAD